MLPFLKPRRVAGLIISQRKSDGSTDVSHQEGDENQGLEACADDIIRAINNKDSKQLAEALRSAFECLQSGPAEEDNSYDAQNIKAAAQENE